MTTPAAIRRQYLAREFSEAERAAIAELLAFVEVLDEAETNKPSRRLRILMMLMMERVANIVRQDDAPRSATNREIMQFARRWRIEERAAFNPPPPVH